MNRTDIEQQIATLTAERDRLWALCGEMRLCDRGEEVLVERPQYIGRVAKLNGQIARLKYGPW